MGPGYLHNKASVAARPRGWHTLWPCRESTNRSRAIFSTCFHTPSLSCCEKLEPWLLGVISLRSSDTHELHPRTYCLSTYRIPSCAKARRHGHPFCKATLVADWVCAALFASSAREISFSLILQLEYYLNSPFETIDISFN